MSRFLDSFTEDTIKRGGVPDQKIVVMEEIVASMAIASLLNIDSETPVLHLKRVRMMDGAPIGTFKHLPPTLLAQYHFAPNAEWSPYLGAGLNYTNISGVHLLNGAGGLEHSSVGLAVQAGVNFKIDRNWIFNIDLKKVQIGSDVTAGGAKISAVKIDPVLFAIGVGYRF